MPYVAPTGWLEPVPGRNRFQMATHVFHRAQQCPAIGPGTALTPTDRPLGSLRCRLCGRAE